MMNQEEIRQLLEKYYSGESTLEEEIILRNFFSHDDIPEDLMEDMAVFSYYSETRDIPEPSAGFEDRILSAIDNSEGKHGKRRLYTVLSGAAAAILIMAGSYFFLFNQKPLEDTYSDPEIAYAETMKILNDVSSRLNKGTKALGKIRLIESETRKGLEKVNNSASLFNEQMKPLNGALQIMRKTETENRNR